MISIRKLQVLCFLLSISMKRNGVLRKSNLETILENEEDRISKTDGKVKNIRSVIKKKTSEEENLSKNIIQENKSWFQRNVIKILQDNDIDLYFILFMILVISFIYIAFTRGKLFLILQAYMSVTFFLIITLLIGFMLIKFLYDDALFPFV